MQGVYPFVQGVLDATPGNLSLVQRMLAGAAEVRHDLFEVHDKPEGE